MRPQKFPHDAEIVGVSDPHEHDRQIAGNAVRPEIRFAPAPRLIGFGGRTQCWRGVNQMAGEALEQRRLPRDRPPGGGAAPAPASRRASPRVESGRDLVLVGRSRACSASAETSVEKATCTVFPGRDAHAAASGSRPDRAPRPRCSRGSLPSVSASADRARCPRPRNCALVGLPLEIAHRLCPPPRHHVREPDLAFLRRSRPAGPREQGVELRQRLRSRMNRLENAGCALSDAAGASTISAYDVTSISRARARR